MKQLHLVLATAAILSSLCTANAQSFPVSFTVQREYAKYENPWDGQIGRKHRVDVLFQNLSDTSYNALDWEFVLLGRNPYNDEFRNLDIKIKLSTLTGQDEIVAPLQSRTVQLYYNYEALTATQPAYGSFYGVFRLRHEGELYVSQNFGHNIVQNPVPEPATALLVMPAVAWIIRKRKSTQRKETAV